MFPILLYVLSFLTFTLKNNVLAALLGSGVNQTRMFYSPKRNVPISTYFLTYIVEGSSELNCSRVSYSSSNISQSIDWPISGYKKYISLLKKYLDSNRKISLKSLNYKDNEIHISNVTMDSIFDCMAQKIILNDVSPAMAFHLCTNGLEQKPYCEVASELYSHIYCLDKISEKLTLPDYCLVVRSFLQKEPNYSRLCSNVISSNLVAEDFFLDFTQKYLNSPSLYISDSVKQQEYRSYYLGIKALKHLKYWTDAHLLCDSAALFNYKDLDDIDDILDSYKPIMYFYGFTSFMKKVPTAILAERAGTNTSAFNDINLLFVIRDSRIDREAAAALNYRLGHTLSRGKVHTGAQALASSLLADFRDIVSKYVFNPKYKNMQFIAIGEGTLGAGAAAILISHISQIFPRLNLNSTEIQYKLMVYDAPHIGDFEFNADLESRVIVRNVISKKFGQIGKALYSMHGCDFDVLHMNAQDDEKHSGYMPLPGIVEYDLSDQRNIDKLWSKDNGVYQLMAQSTACGTECWLSTEFCRDEEKTLCFNRRSSCNVLDSGFA